jgi:hypothetical protein
MIHARELVVLADSHGASAMRMAYCRGLYGAIAGFASRYATRVTPARA